VLIHVYKSLTSSHKYGNCTPRCTITLNAISNIAKLDTIK
jgi:hypothetical protein